MTEPDFDPLSARWALAILVVVGALLVSIAIRADEPIAAEARTLERVEALAEAPDVAPEPASDLAARALAWVDHRSDAAFRFGPAAVRRGWPDRLWVAAELVPAALEAAQGARFPERWPDAEALLALAWRESRWRPSLVGGYVYVHGRLQRGHGGEVGVAQVKPRNCRQYAAGEDCADTRVNLRIAATILRELLERCEGRHRWALRAYGGIGVCRPPRHADDRVAAWADQIRRTVP